MNEIPVFYATTEGQTRRIAERIAGELRTHGLNSTAIDVTTAAAALADWDQVRGVILGASIHAGHHQAGASEFARTFQGRLNAVPSAFFSVSLSTASAVIEEREAADRLARQLPQEAGWQPSRIACFAGRLAYTQYGALKRLILRSIAKHEGGPTDTHRDHELTDWAAVVRFANDMAQAIKDAERRSGSFMQAADSRARHANTG
jgi:menaquinone-dependent protoporphyrinogen oxidase